MAVSTSSRRPGDEDPSQDEPSPSGHPAPQDGEADLEHDTGYDPEYDDDRDNRQTPFEGLSARPRPISVSDDQQLATLSHMLGIAGCLPSMVIHRWSRGRARFTEQESLEAANFTIVPTLVIIACLLLAFIPYLGWIFALLAAAAWLFLAVFSLHGAIVVNKGRPCVYRYNTYFYDLLTRRRAERKAARASSGPMTATGEIVNVSGARDTRDGAGAENDKG
ncbi:DUF4870 domain-containing protein [Kocuria coralli]|uniref:DUF4870 domain-containing protein n=1 Tax=Kocuria coralli TaxID=1461025 RepID=A0A5J5L090_9MICC|nr:DUF4870 domain-containing protein [Kocuria coralli]KAA9395038.1 DUF4870 domain-containing protein [Kocuria coralli]